MSRLLAAGLSWPSRSPSSPFGAAPASVSVASVSQDSLSASLSLLSRSLVPRRPAVGQEELGWGRRPLGCAWFRTQGSGNPGQPGMPGPRSIPGALLGRMNRQLCCQRLSSSTGKLGRMLAEGAAPSWALQGEGYLGSVWPQPPPPPSPYRPPPHPHSQALLAHTLGSRVAAVMPVQHLLWESSQGVWRSHRYSYL